LLGKHVDLFTDRLEVNAGNDEPLLDMPEDEIFLSCCLSGERRGPAT
jgi:hypothetical protein